MYWRKRIILTPVFDIWQTANCCTHFLVCAKLKNMDSIYKVVKIEGKDLGCVAIKDIKKGTLILQEKPQCFANASGPSKIDLTSLLNSFNKMSQEHQEGFLKLHNRFETLEALELTNKQKEWIETNAKDEEKMFQIYGIYRTNSFENGVAINFARFNHSCCSNAEAMWNEEENASEIRSVSKIKAGEEITLTYNWKQLAMKNWKTRQDNLWYNWGFKCCCDVCKEEESNPDQKTYQIYEQLQQEVRKCLENQKNQDKVARLDNIKREVTCHKEMYKLAKEKKASRMFIVNDILDDGFNAAAQGYLTSESSYSIKKMESFRKDCEIFAIAGEQLSKVLPNFTQVEWTRRKNDFDGWMKEVKESIREQQMNMSHFN